MGFLNGFYIPFFMFARVIIYLSLSASFYTLLRGSIVLFSFFNGKESEGIYVGMYLILRPRKEKIERQINNSVE